MIDRPYFFSHVRPSIFANNLKQSQVDGINAILDAWDDWAPNSDNRFIAYALATAYHETAATMQPIEEYGRGNGHVYGRLAGPWAQRFYGRGYVQLTWDSNYVNATAKLRARGILSDIQNLERNPELALVPSIAAPIMIFGMLEGWFTGRKLSDYFSASANDAFNARRIINGLDSATSIAITHQEFLEGIE